MGTPKALFLAAAVATGASFAAKAAELLPPAPAIDDSAPAEFDGWYLRGDLGVGAVQMSGWRPAMQSFDAAGPASGNFIAPAFSSIGDQGFVGIGVGYHLNEWFRADITGEYRTEASYRAGVIGMNAFSGQVGGASYNAGVSTALFMANGYVDLGVWRGVTPFVGFGVGVADNKISSFGDAGAGIAAGKTKANFAWAAMAGLALGVTPNLEIELSYRYLDMGGVSTNPVGCMLPSSCFRQTHSFHLASNDIRLGFRYAFGDQVVSTAPLAGKY